MTSKELQLKCYFFTNEDLPIKRFFTLPIAANGSLTNLIGMVQNWTKTKSNITLYKAEDLYYDPANNLHERVAVWLEQHIEEAMDSVVSGLLREIWPGPDGGDWSLPRKFDFIAVDQSALDNLKTIHALPDPALRPRVNIINEHTSQLERFAAAPSPSAGSQNPKSCYDLIRGGRPAACHGPSNALFDPHLARLSHELRNLHVVEVTSEMIYVAYRLLTASAKFYSNENAREQPIRQILEEIFPAGTWQTLIANSRAKPEAFWLLPLIFELKNERGIGGDPDPQAILDYIKLLSDKELSGNFRAHSNCPSVLLSLAGTQLNISTVVFTDAVYVEELYSENLHGGFDVDDRTLRLARALQAVKNAFNELSHFYTMLKADNSPSDGSHLLPRPVHADAPHPELVDTLGLRFLYKLSRKGGQIGKDSAERNENMCHAIYVALSNGTSIPAGQVVVKFALRYNVQAHRLLADADLAPKLYYHCPVLGGYTMIVMEHVAGKMAWVWQQAELLMPHTVYADVERAVSLLHHEGIVFGDLRLPNIMVREDNHRAVLIDFDWAAKEGEGRYPATIFAESFDHGWAWGVQRYGLMEKRHDQHMLKSLKIACEKA